MKIKNAAVILMIASIYWILADVYWTIDRFTGPKLEYFKDNVLSYILQTMIIIVPVSLLFVSVALMKNKTETSSSEIEALPKENVGNLSIGDWLINFLITIIPLVGFIFIIIWANDDKNKLRKNWAIASLIWSGIIFVLSLFFYGILFATIMNRY
jgi:hypothetical protein